jgi:hypothetical protein
MNKKQTFYKRISEDESKCSQAHYPPQNPQSLCLIGKKIIPASNSWIGKTKISPFFFKKPENIKHCKITIPIQKN